MKAAHLIFLVLTSLARLQAADFFVATNGSDNNPGTLGQPFATLERARDAIRELQSTNAFLSTGINVWIRAGTYVLPETFSLTFKDSGRPNAPIIYRSYGQEHPLITSGRIVTGFTPYQGEILKSNLGDQGLKVLSLRQLFFDGKRQSPARYPKFDPQNPISGGWAYVDGKLEPMYSDIPGEDKRTLHYKLEDERSWKHPEDAEVVIFPRYNWSNNIIPITSIDKANRLITLSGDCSYAIRPNDRYFIQNVLEELNSPGEWCLNKRENILYFWPPEKREGVVTVPTLENLVQLKGPSNVILRGLSFAYCSGNAIELQGANNCRVEGCTIHDVGFNGSGIVINGGKKNGVVGNDISETGKSGISIYGGDRIHLEPAENYADNNVVHHTGIYFKQASAIEMVGCGDHVSHNLIYSAPRAGIYFSGNNLTVEYNHIHDVCQETEDGGAIYTSGRDWISSRGSRIQYNFCHDVSGFGQHNGKWVSPYFTWGIYLDDNTGGVDVIGNVVARCGRGCLALHNARDNVIQNNIFIDGNVNQMEWRGWSSKGHAWQSYYPLMQAGYNSVINQPAWKVMRHINVSPSQSILSNGLTMIGNEVTSNIFYFTKPSSLLYQMYNVPFDHNVIDKNLIFSGQQAVLMSYSGEGELKPKILSNTDFVSLGLDGHSITADPDFVDATHDDYQLKPTSPAYQLGFKDIPSLQIGPYSDERRASWPIIERSN